MKQLSSDFGQQQKGECSITVQPLSGSNFVTTVQGRESDSPAVLLVAVIKTRTQGNPGS